jgi:beta-fructofuranosidase
VHWSERPVALSPDDADDGVWSGCVVEPEGGTARLFYTSVRSERLGLGVVRTASPDDDTWDTWHKSDVVLVAPEGLELVELRDPFVCRDGEVWRLVAGGGTADGTAMALGWTSGDLESWAYDGVMASRPTTETAPVWTGSAWECPQLVRVDDRWVLVVSVWDDGQTHFEAYAVGDLVDGRFVAGPWRRLSHGPAHYAASAFTDADGRPCLLHWLRGVADPHGRWAGAHSVPHLLGLDGDRLVVEPHPAVGDAAEVLLPGATRSFAGLDVRLADDLTLTVHHHGQTWTMPATGGDVRLLADGPVLEIFGPFGVAGFVIAG